MTRSPTYITGLCVAATIVAQASTRSATPGPRIGHGLAFDEARGRTVLFGGFGPDGVPQSDTWEWDGEAWQLSSKEGPSARRWPAMVYDAARGHVILFGGREGVGRGGASRGDTWEWDGKVWKELRSDDGPSGRDHHAMVYDRARGRIVVFGGWDGEGVVGDTWEWNGKWQRVGRNGPPARAAHAMAYDGKRGIAVLFGGRALEVFFDDTWLWDGKEWSQVDAHGPPKRAFHGMTYVPESQNTVLFGGRLNSDLYGDTWVWDGQRWTEIPVDGPSRRYVYSMSYGSYGAYELDRKRALFFGGGHRESDRWVLFDETWLWNGSQWQKPDRQ